MVQAMIERGPYVRFAWGLSTDSRLNHHPQPPAGIDAQTWQGRHFDLNAPRLFLRLERQILWGFPTANAALFTIRTYFRDCATLRSDANLCTKLCAAIESMNAESLHYKGLFQSKPPILEWLTHSP